MKKSKMITLSAGTEKLNEPFFVHHSTIFVPLNQMGEIRNTNFS